MQHRDLSIEFSERARKDLLEISLYTIINWGVDQSERYEDLINKAILTILEHPSIGRPIKLKF